MEITQKILDEIYTEITARNKELAPGSVVHSDSFIKYMASSTGLPKESVKTAIAILIESHKVLSIEIVTSDEKRRIEQVDGYVAADLSVVRNLNSFFKDHLVKAYEFQFHKRAGSAQIVRELFPMIKSLNNTELGQVLNKTIMLHEYERLLEKEWRAYAPEWQEQRLAELSLKYGFHYKPSVPVNIPQQVLDASAAINSEEPVSNTRTQAKTNVKTERAVDAPQYKEFADKESQYPLQRILNIYGIDFFVKVQFRKYKFSYVRKIIEDKQIVKKKDLLFIREMISKVKDSDKFGRDSNLESCRDEINRLERAVTHAIYFSV